MTAKSVVKSGENKTDLINLLILLFIAAVIGIYLIFTTVLISKDGVYYIEEAQQFACDPIKIIRHHTPGHPVFILLAHKFVSLFISNTSNQAWIYSAQSVTLLCRLLTLIPLYLIGKLLVGSKKSFWAILILICLPFPTKMACDVVREWPHLLFLATGLLFLIWASREGKWWMFAIAGLVSGLGHAIRPECAQVVLYGMLWAVITLFHPKRNMSRPKTICLTIILIAAFSIPTAPHMKLRGQILPPQLRNLFISDTADLSDAAIDTDFVKLKSVYAVSGVSSHVLTAFGRLLTRLSEHLLYFFILPLIVGLYYHFRRIHNFLFKESFFINRFF